MESVKDYQYILEREKGNIIDVYNMKLDIVQFLRDRVEKQHGGNPTLCECDVCSMSEALLEKLLEDY